jgi:hypothetical protein
MRQNKKDQMYKDILKHGNNLKRLFGLTCDPIELCNKLHRLELKANRKACDYCNGVIDCDQWEIFSERTKCKVLDIIGQQWGAAVFINSDARGYTLKIDDQWLKMRNENDIHRDWGGYGILAPDFTPQK